MRIAMFTNAYRPIIGGLERSIDTFVEDFRLRGHRTLVVTLSFPGAGESDADTVRLPAIQEVGGTPFSVRLPVPAGLKERLDAFRPDIIHSHHPFMLGDTALRVARRRGLPVVFTHHTLYERYAYLFSRESEALQRIARAIATEYANLCDLVIAPTASIAGMIRARGVAVPIEVIPTGIDVERFRLGRGAEFRRAHGIPADAFVAGYLGRVVEAKNMEYLAEALARFLARNPDAWALLAGDGESVAPVRRRFDAAGVGGRVAMPGVVTGAAVADAYAAMDLFAFASQTDTQGIVLVEALSAGVPVVGLDATGTRDIVADGETGILLPAAATPADFASALERLSGDRLLCTRLGAAAVARARDFDRGRSAGRMLQAYARLLETASPARDEEPPLWSSLQERFLVEWDLFREKLAVMAAAMAE